MENSSEQRLNADVPTGTTSWYWALLTVLNVLDGLGKTGGPEWRESSPTWKCANNHSECLCQHKHLGTEKWEFIRLKTKHICQGFAWSLSPVTTAAGSSWAVRTVTSKTLFITLGPLTGRIKTDAKCTAIFKQFHSEKRPKNYNWDTFFDFVI